MPLRDIPCISLDIAKSISFLPTWCPLGTYGGNSPELSISRIPDILLLFYPYGVPPGLVQLQYPRARLLSAGFLLRAKASSKTQGTEGQQARNRNMFKFFFLPTGNISPPHSIHYYLVLVYHQVTSWNLSIAFDPCICKCQGPHLWKSLVQ